MLRNLVPYTCSLCRGVTYAPPHLTAVTCTKCNRIDLGTEIALRRWKTVAEIVRDNTPTPVIVRHQPASLLVALAWAIVVAFGCALVTFIVLGSVL